MAVQLQVSHAGKNYNRILFGEVTLSATFLKMLAGREEVSGGTIRWSPDCKIGYLEQEIVTDTVDISGGEKKILRLAVLFCGDYNVLVEAVTETGYALAGGKLMSL